MEGLFRKCGNCGRQKILREKLNGNEDVGKLLAAGTFNVHDCASTIKMFLSELPEPLLTDRHFDLYCLAAELEADKLLQLVQIAVQFLPPPNVRLLRLLLDLLRRTTEQKENLMTAASLGIIFAPHFIIPRKMNVREIPTLSASAVSVVSLLIIHSSSVFRLPPAILAEMRRYCATASSPSNLNPPVCGPANSNPSVSCPIYSGTTSLNQTNSGPPNSGAAISGPNPPNPAASVSSPDNASVSSQPVRSPPLASSSIPGPVLRNIDPRRLPLSVDDWCPSKRVERRCAIKRSRGKENVPVFAHPESQEVESTAEPASGPTCQNSFVMASTSDPASDSAAPSSGVPSSQLSTPTQSKQRRCLGETIKNLLCSSGHRSNCGNNLMPSGSSAEKESSDNQLSTDVIEVPAVDSPRVVIVEVFPSPRDTSHNHCPLTGHYTAPPVRRSAFKDAQTRTSARSSQIRPKSGLTFGPPAIEIRRRNSGNNIQHTSQSTGGLKPSTSRRAMGNVVVNTNYRISNETAI